MNKRIQVLRLKGLVNYSEAWNYQKLLQEVLNDQRKQKEMKSDDMIGGYLLMLEHKPTITIGKGGNASNILLKEKPNSKYPQVYRVERGGDVTWHGPGQLTVYPILDLNYYKKDLHWL